MHITFSPVRRDERLDLARKGEALIVNGEAFDFTALPEGGSLPPEAIASTWFAGPVERVGGQVRLALVLPHGSLAPAATLFPADIEAAKDGPITLPPHSTEA